MSGHTGKTDIAPTLAGKDLALPAGSLILVTGTSGFIGSHAANEALRAGYKVRGTVRSQEKGENTKKVLGNHPNYSYVIVEDFQHEGVFDEAMKGCAAVMHLASDTTFGSDPNKVVTATVNGVLSILRSAAKASSVKRFVLTSSSTAALLPKPNKAVTVTTDTWNQETVDIAWAPPPYTEERAFEVYGASKTEAERAFWKFLKEEKPGFVGNTILPNMNTGRILPGGRGGPTGECCIGIVKDHKLPDFPPQWQIDVIDDARLHLIAAALDPNVKDQRIFAFAQPFNWTQVLEMIRELRPNDKNLPTAPENEGKDLSKIPNELGAKLLTKWYGQDGYKPMKESVRENIEGV